MTTWFLCMCVRVCTHAREREQVNKRASKHISISHTCTSDIKDHKYVHKESPVTYTHIRMTHTHMHTHIQTHTYTYRHTHTHIVMHRHTHTQSRIHTRTRTRTRTHTHTLTWSAKRKLLIYCIHLSHLAISSTFTMNPPKTCSYI